MKKLILVLLFTSSTLFAQASLFDTMDKETLKNTGVSKLTDGEKMALMKWLESSQKQAKIKIEQQVRQEVKEQVSQEVRQEIKNEVKQEVREEIKNEVTKEVEKKERKKFMGFTMKENDREVIESRVIGEVNGWNGKSVITLENGQVWTQAEKTKVYFSKKVNPKVLIKPKSFNTWALSVEGYNRSIKVKRIK